MAWKGNHCSIFFLSKYNLDDLKRFGKHAQSILSNKLCYIRKTWAVRLLYNLFVLNKFVIPYLSCIILHIGVVIITLCRTFLSLK